MSNLDFNLSDETTLNLGTDKAPFELTAILNLGCPYSQAWWLANEAELLRVTSAGYLNLHLKFWSKPSPLLTAGNVANTYIDYSHPDAALAYVQATFHQQDDLRAAPDTDAYLRGTYQLAPLAASVIVAQQVVEEADRNQLSSLPSFIVNDELVAGSESTVVAAYLTKVFDYRKDYFSWKADDHFIVIPAARTPERLAKEAKILAVIAKMEKREAAERSSSD